MPAVVDLAAMRDAMVALGGDPESINPLVPVDLVIDHSVMVDEFGNALAFAAQCRARIRAQRRALPLPALGPARLRQFPRRAARHRHLPPGQPRISRPDRLDRQGRRRTRRLSRHAGRHRLPHHHDQRPRRARLGRRRHRGRGRHARPADLHAHPRGRSASADRPADRRRHRHRPGAHRHPDAAQEGRGRQIRRVLRRRASRTCRWTTGPPSPTWPRNTAPPAASSRSTRTRSTISRRPAATRSASRWSRPMPRRRACSARTARPIRCSPTRWRSTSPPSCPRWPGRSARRTASRSPMPTPPSRRRSPTSATSTAATRPPTWTRKAAARCPSSIARPRSRARTTSSTDGDVVIAAITSCTNTSNPCVLIAAGLVAQNAHEKGLTAKPWVKTSLAPGSQVVTDYLAKAGLQEHLDALGFNLVGYGCTTCIGNSGPLPEEISEAIGAQGPGRRLGAFRQPQLRGPRQSRYARQLPRLAAAGRRLCADRHDARQRHHRAARHGQGRQAGLPQGHLADVEGGGRDRPHHHQPGDVPHAATPTSSRATPQWRKISVTGGQTYAWSDTSTYVQNPPYFDGMAMTPEPVERHRRARASSASSSIRSPPTTSRPPARSSATARPANI